MKALQRRGGAASTILVILFVIFLVASIVYYWYYITFAVWQGVNYKVDATVVRVEESTKFFPHTYIDVQITVQQSDKYTLYGNNLGIQINHRYHLEWISGIMWRWDTLNFIVVGYPTKITEIG